MSKPMTLEVLSSIKGATSSTAVEELFQTLRKIDIASRNISALNLVELNELREDKVLESSAEERALIHANFPAQKNGYLVVPKVIEE